MRRRPFILLELFIALALLSLSIIPIASYPFKIYKNELNRLIELQLAEMAEVAFRNLLQDLPSYIDPETLEPYATLPETPYTICLSDKHQWIYTAVWELKCKLPKQEPFDKASLNAKLIFRPSTKDLPKPEPFIYRYFLAKKPTAPHGETNEGDQTVPAVCTGGEKAS